MKVALVHDYLKEYGGAEGVLETLSEIFPDAPIYTSLYCPESFGPHRDRLVKKWSHRIHQSFFQWIPFASKLLSPLRFVSPLAFRSFDFSQYDVILTSATGAFFPNSLHKHQAKLICYCHTPPRYLYGLATARTLDTWFYRLVNLPLQFILHFYRLFDYNFSRNVDLYLANSRTTAARIQKYYRQDSLVINPPVDVEKIPSPSSQHRSSDFYLTGGRLARAKNYHLAIQACNQLGLILKVYGRDFAGYESELKSIAGPKIEFLGEVDNQTKFNLLSQARAFFFCSDNEDFGIVPVEAMAAGCPVIGYNSGGIKETVVDGKTGVLFDQLTVNDCLKAIQKLDTLDIKPSDCRLQAEKFSKKTFVSRIKRVISR